MENNKENKVGCTWSFNDDPFYVAMKITYLRLQKKDQEIERLKNKGNVIK